MHSKIKEIRMRLGLSEAQVSSLLNISSYKYRRYEDGSLTISVEVFALLSIMYDVSIDLLVFDKFNVNVIFKEESILKLLSVSKKERTAILESNMCKYCTFNCSSINYRVVKNIIVRFLNNFSKNLYELRCMNLFEVSEVSSLLNIEVERYIHLENGKSWPTVYELIEIVSAFSKSINEILEIKNETDF